MTRLLTLLLTLLVLSATLFTFVAPATACTCGATTVASLVEQADIVVTGSVQEIEDDGDVRFAVDLYYKGEGEQTILVLNPDKDLDPDQLTDLSRGSLCVWRRPTFSSAR